MRAEIGVGGIEPLSDEDLLEFTNECIGNLAKEREKMGAEAYEREVTCVLDSRNMEQLMACDPPESAD